MPFLALKWLRKRSLLGISVACSCVSVARAVNLELSDVSVAAGSTVTINLNLTASQTELPASMQWTIHYSTGDFSSVVVTPGAGGTVPGKALSCDQMEGLTSCVLWGQNNARIPDGVVATLHLTASPEPSSLVSNVLLTDVAAASAAGAVLQADTRAGSVRLLPRLDGLSCDPLSIPSLGSVVCTVAVAPAVRGERVTVALSASSDKLKVPASVTIPEGSNSVTFTAVAESVSTSIPVTVSASYSGIDATFDIAIRPQEQPVRTSANSPPIFLGLSL